MGLLAAFYYVKGTLVCSIAAVAALAAVLFAGISKFKVGIETLEKVMRLASGGGGPGFTQAGREVPGKDKIEGWADMSAAEKMAAARRR